MEATWYPVPYTIYLYTDPAVSSPPFARRYHTVGTSAVEAFSAALP